MSERARRLLARPPPFAVGGVLVLPAAGLLALAQLATVRAALPVLGLLRGPLGWSLLLGALALAAGAILGGRVPALEAPPVVGAGPAPPRPRGRALFAATAAAYLLLGLAYSSRLRVSGDEPHYLIMAQSLWREGDLDLRDNYARQDYLEYTPGPLAPHFGALRRDGRPFPSHAPGLPLLLAPFYALGGRLLCVALLALAAAALTVEVRALALAATGDSRAALLAWAASAGPPTAYYAFHVYTEVPSALALALALRLLLASPGPARAAAAGLLASTLPWLHVKMALPAAALAAVALLRLRGRALLAFAAVCAAMAGGFLLHFWRVFGTPSPLALYGGIPRGEMGAPSWAATGLLLDRSFGLWPYAPVFLLAIPGAARALRSCFDAGGRARWIPHVLVGASVAVPIVAWRMWWGGQCPPGRFLVPAVPFLGVALAAQAAATRKGLVRWGWPLLMMSAALLVFMTAWPAELLLLNRSDRPTRAWSALGGDETLNRYLPSLVSPSAEEARVAAVWLAVVAVLLALDAAAQRRPGLDAAFRGLLLPLALFLLAGWAVDRWARPNSAGAASAACPGEPRTARPG